MSLSSYGKEKGNFNINILTRFAFSGIDEAEITEALGVLKRYMEEAVAKKASSS